MAFFRKYSKNEKLGHLSCDYVEKCLELIKSKEGLDREFCPKKYIQYIFINVAANSTFAKG